MKYTKDWELMNNEINKPAANTGFMLLLRLGFFGRLVSYLFSFSSRFIFKSFRYICFGL
jgi:hypothetical protein